MNTGANRTALNRSIGCPCIQRIWSVSYTHLDVYKRQDRNGSIIAFYSKEQLGSNAIKGISEDEMSNVWVGTGTVSYTHLFQKDLNPPNKP